MKSQADRQRKMDSGWAGHSKCHLQCSGPEVIQGHVHGGVLTRFCTEWLTERD